LECLRSEAVALAVGFACCGSSEQSLAIFKAAYRKEPTATRYSSCFGAELVFCSPMFCRVSVALMRSSIFAPKRR